jgi:SPP1 gp7 family putative phage head morphogenesis protein
MADPTLLDLAMQARTAVLRRDAAALERLTRAYAAINTKVEAEMAALVEVVLAKGGNLTNGQLQRLVQYKNLLTTVETEVNKYGGYLQVSARAEAEALIAQAGRDAKTLIAQAVGGGVDQALIRSMPPNTIETLLGFLDPDGELWKYWSKGKAGKDTANLIAQVIYENIGIGRNPNAWKNALREAMGSTLTSALKTARTVQLWSYREANRANYIANADVVKQWQWVSKLDATTCAACLALHGTIYDTDVPMEGHWNCRCTLVPVTILNPKGADIEKGEAWFADQSAATQKEILGPSKYSAWQNGEFKFSQLAQHADDSVFGKMWRETPLKELIQSPTSTMTA